MKYISRISFLLLCLGLFTTSCKKPAGDAAKTGAAKDVAAAAASAKSYAVNTAASQVLWTGSKATGQHAGTINITNGQLQVVGSAVTGGTFTLDMNSINVTDLEGGKKADLEGHLKGMAEGNKDHFFNVAKFPTAKFQITSVTPATSNPDANTNITGNLTMRDKTNSITFPANVVVIGGKVNAVTPPFTINRTLWGVNYGSASVFDNLKDNVISGDISLQINLEAGSN